MNHTFFHNVAVGFWLLCHVVIEISGVDENPATAPPPAKSWAIIVGISDNTHKQDWNLKYAMRDAEVLCELLQKPPGGTFAKDHIRLLTDETATTDNIARALHTFLKKPAENNVVLLYFACHGAQDPERPGRV